MNDTAKEPVLASHQSVSDKRFVLKLRRQRCTVLLWLVYTGKYVNEGSTGD